jgi:putative ABC transport system ATP-binding protein
VSEPLVDARGLQKTYTMGSEVVRALDGVDLQVNAGEMLAIIGQSGSGKSTLMNLLGCLDTPSGGSYRLAGESVEELEDDELADVRNRHIGFVFQSFHLLPRQSALDNVALPLVYRRGDAVPLPERRRRAAAALERVGLLARAAHRPTELSGGQRQRVAIARALINDPSIVLADEPTGNLDSKTSDEILSLLTTLQREQGRTIIVVTHEPDVAARCQRVVQLKDGKVVRDARAELVSP